MVQKKRDTYNETLGAVVLSMIATMAALFGSASLSMLSTDVQLIGSLLFGVIVFYVMKRAIASMQSDSPVNKILIKLLAISVLLSIAVAVGSAIRSFWISPFDSGYPDRFVYENVAVGFSLGAVIGMCILSFLQKDLFWISRKKSNRLDERQAKERQEVYEKSYRIGALSLLLMVWYFSGTLHNMPAIIANHYGSVPGHFKFIALDILVFFIGLPLIVGAFKGKK